MKILILCVALLVPPMVFGADDFVDAPRPSRVDAMKFDSGKLQVDSQVDAVLDFPNISLGYVYGNEFHTLLMAEIHRWKSVHADIGIGEQFVGISAGYTFLDAGNLSVLAGAGYNLDRSNIETFFGFSHRSSILAYGRIKNFVGYDILMSRLRFGFAYNLWKRGSWALDAVGTAKFFGKRNFLGFSLAKDLFADVGAGLKTKPEVDIGAFVGYDFSETTKNKIGAGLSANIRF